MTTVFIAQIWLRRASGSYSYPCMVQKLEKIAQIYLPYLPTFASLASFSLKCWFRRDFVVTNVSRQFSFSIDFVVFPCQTSMQKCGTTHGPWVMGGTEWPCIIFHAHEIIKFPKKNMFEWSGDTKFLHNLQTVAVFPPQPQTDFTNIGLIFWPIFYIMVFIDIF